MSWSLKLSVALILLVYSSISAASLAQCAKNLQVAVYEDFNTNRSFFLDDKTSRKWCKEAASEKAKTGSVSGGYADYSFAGSSAEAEAAYELECTDDLERTITKEETKSKIRQINAKAMDSYDRCLDLVSGGIEVAVTRASKEMMDVFLTVRSDTKVKEIEIISEGDVKCEGKLAKANKKRLLLLPRSLKVKDNATVAMTCKRAEEKGGRSEYKDVTFLMEFAGDKHKPWLFPWAGQKACGEKGRPSCNNTKAVKFEKYPEEAEGYNQAALISSETRLGSLKSRLETYSLNACSEVEKEKMLTTLAERSNEEWGAVEVSAKRGSSCTVGNSWGKCGSCSNTRATKEAPRGFLNHKIERYGRHGNVSWSGTKGQIHLSRNTCGKSTGGVTAIWKMSPSEIRRRTDLDLTALKSLSHCFNGCDAGLIPNRKGFCQ